MVFLRRLFNPPSVPAQYRSNFTHLYLDIGWFGILSGTSISFLSIYATRLGASGLQIGLLGAVSALVNLVFAIPAGRWFQGRPAGRAVFWTSVLYRLGFLLWVPLPWLFGADNQGQIWALIGLTLLMGIPLTVLSLGFNALFAEAVPTDWRAYVAGMRNVVLSITFMGASLLSGFLLNRLPFPQGYQVVFGIGFVGAAMSSLHLYFIKPLAENTPPADGPDALQSPRGEASPSFFERMRTVLRTDVWHSHYGTVLLALLAFHLSQYLAIPIFPLYSVRVLHLTDEQIGIGTALFYLTVFIGSTQLDRLVRGRGHKAVTAAGLMAMGLYPALMGLSSQVWHYYALSFIGGMGWSLVGGAYANYLLENIPEHDRPAHLAWYTIVLNACILIGSLLGPWIADGLGLAGALLLFGLLRFLAGLSILKWG